MRYNSDKIINLFAQIFNSAYLIIDDNLIIQFAHDPSQIIRHAFSKANCSHYHRQSQISNTGYEQNILDSFIGVSSTALSINGEKKYYIYFNPLKDNNDNITSCLCFITVNDCTNNYLDAGISKDGFFEIDRNYIIRKQNKAVTDYLGTNKVIGTVCYKIFHGFSAPCTACPAIEVFRTGSVTHSTIFDAKRQRFLALSASPTFDPVTGEVDGAIENFRDVSDLIEIANSANDFENSILMLDALPICCGLFNKEFKMIDCNRATVNFFQCTGKIETCERIFQMFPKWQPDGRLSSDAAISELNKALEIGYNRVEWTFLLPDGALVPTEVIVVKTSCGDRDMLATFTRDLREEKALRAAHDEANELIRLMFEATPLCCNLWDDHYNIIACNMEAVKLFELSSKNEYLTRFFDLSPKKQPNGHYSHSLALNHIKRTFTNGYNRFEWLHQKLNGESIPAEITLVRINRGDKYIVAGYTRDLRKEILLNEAKEAALNAAQRDHLTHLYNKTTTQRLIEEALSGPDSIGRHALVCIDIDDFKTINDQFGHLFGDKILVEISTILKRVFRADDIIGRFGGDEFIVFVRDIPDLEVIYTKLDLLCSDINKIYRLNNNTYTVSASIGVSIFPDDGNSYIELYTKADSASYYSKKSGKNQHTTWQECAEQYQKFFNFAAF